MTSNEPTPADRIHRVQCAATITGCQSALLWRSRSEEIDHELLTLNGWRQDYGRWICGNHHLIQEPRS